MSSLNRSAVANLALVVLIFAGAWLRDAVAASAESRPDADLVADCVRELASRAFEGVQADHLAVSSSEVKRD